MSFFVRYVRRHPRLSGHRDLASLLSRLDAEPARLLAVIRSGFTATMVNDTSVAAWATSSPGQDHRMSEVARQIATVEIAEHGLGGAGHCGVLLRTREVLSTRHRVRGEG